MCCLTHSSRNTKGWSGAPLEKSLQSHKDHKMPTDQLGLRQKNVYPVVGFLPRWLYWSYTHKTFNPKSMGRQFCRKFFIHKSERKTLSGPILPLYSEPNECPLLHGSWLVPKDFRINPRIKHGRRLHGKTLACFQTLIYLL